MTDVRTGSTKEIMRIAEAAEYLGVSEGVLYRWGTEGRIPVIRISKRCIRYRRSVLDQWLDAMTAPFGRQGRERSPR